MIESPFGVRLFFGCSFYIMFNCRFGAFSLRCSFTNADVCNSIATDEAPKDGTSLESSCSVPIIRLNSDSLGTEGDNLLVGRTFVDSIFTALPVS